MVALSRSGDRDSFRRIVDRYQSLVCSLAYSSCGSVTQSEDIAQEVFFSAWKQLRALRDPDRLKEWLCGIARQSAIQAYRRNRREPSHLAAELPPDAIAPGPQPVESATRREEELLLWRALERLPATYREVLVLYYREHRSLEHVAVALDLTEENVRQRLSRGRKELQEEVMRMLDNSLSTSAPGAAFTAAVVAGLPPLAAVGPMAIGGSVVKGGSAFKAALTGLAFFATWITGLFVALLGMFFQLRGASTLQERRRAIRKWAILWFGCIAYVGALCALSFVSRSYWAQHAGQRTVIVVAGTVTYLFAVGNFIWRCAGGRADLPLNEFRTRASFLGLPLVHVRYGLREQGRIVPARGWLAIGDVAYGRLMACGVFTLAPISCGVFSLGAISLGGLAIGGFGFGFVAFGFYAMGGIAVGYVAAGGGAVGWLAAVGAIVRAHHFASGSAAATIGGPAGDLSARRALAEMFFFRHGQLLLGACLAASWLPLLFSLWWRRRRSQMAKTVS